MKNRVQCLLLGSTPEATLSWRESLDHAGWETDHLPSKQRPLVDLCQKYQVIILTPGSDSEETISSMLKICAEPDAAAFLPILSSPTANEIVQLIRLGVNDVLIEPFSGNELTETVERVARRRNLYQENRAYSSRLEKIGKELQDSLNILRMDHMAGRQVQNNLLPPAPLVFNGYTLSHKIIPSLYLSGDFVAYHLVFDRYILFYIADVSGHGASSAFVTILLHFILKRIIRKHLLNNDVEALVKAPDGFIEHVNRQMLATGLEKQIAMFAGAIDTKTNLLRYSVAAQVPMPVFVVGDDARFLPGKGKIIGLFDDVSWQVEEIALPETFQLIMVSDGLLETLPAKGLQAQQRYLLETLAGASPNHEAMCRALSLDKVSEAADDVSILTICRGANQ